MSFIYVTGLFPPRLLQFDRKRAEIPVYSFAKHQRTEETTTIYSPHVLILEGIFALYDPRVLELMDMRACHPYSGSCPSSLTLSRYSVRQMPIHVCHEEVCSHAHQPMSLLIVMISTQRCRMSRTVSRRCYQAVVHVGEAKFREGR